VFILRPNRKCFKKGHKSVGAAEAHLRGLLKSKEFKPDYKANQQLRVYYCIARSCQKAPWHVGHDKYSQTETQCAKVTAKD